MHHDANAGFNPRLAERMTAVLPACVTRGITIVSNMGAANPRGAAHRVCEIARQSGLDDLRCAALVGDDVAEIVRALPALRLLETDAPLESILPAWPPPTPISAPTRYAWRSTPAPKW